jgi:hypothetical protein
MGELFKVIGFSRGIDGTLDVARGDRSHALGRGWRCCAG